MTTRALTLLLAALLTVVGVACGSDDDSDSADVESACRALCDQQGEATGCDGDDAAWVADCKLGCPFVAANFANACGAEATALFDCQAGLSYECEIVGEGEEIRVPTTDGCVAQESALLSCID